MIFKEFKDAVLLPEKKDVLRIHLYFKLLQYNIRPFEPHIDLILELYTFGGYNGPEEQGRFLQVCVDKGIRKSAQGVRNIVSKYVQLGVLNSERNTHAEVNEKYIPKAKVDKIALTHIIGHAN